MKKIVIAPDSFKGTLSSLEICNIIKEEIKGVFPKCQVISVPIADGGEGTVDSFIMSVKGEKVNTEVTGPYFEKIQSYYGLIDGGKTAIIEMAAAAGLPMVKGRENPLKTTTYGVGELILEAIKAGAKNIIIGLGGSSTNDGGCGLAAALGIEFLDKEGKSFIPVGETLGEITKIDTTKINKKLKGIKMSAMCDVTNPLYGPKGAAYIFGPQKGADEAIVKLLDESLRKYGNILEKIPGKEDISTLPGAGAAGGLGAGLNAFLDVPLLSGIDLILETIRFEELIEDSDLIITGEGKIDGQSLGGKAIFGVTKYAKSKDIPLLVMAGDALDKELDRAYDLGVSGIFPTNRQALPFTGVKQVSADNLRYTIRNILTLLKDIKNTQ